MTKKNYSKYEAKEELVTLSFNHVLLHKKDTKIYQVIFLSLLSYLFLCYSKVRKTIHKRECSAIRIVVYYPLLILSTNSIGEVN